MKRRKPRNGIDQRKSRASTVMRLYCRRCGNAIHREHLTGRLPSLCRSCRVEQKNDADRERVRLAMQRLRARRRAKE